MKFRCAEAELRATFSYSAELHENYRARICAQVKFICVGNFTDITNTHFLKTIFILMNIFYDSIQTEQKL